MRFKDFSTISTIVLMASSLTASCGDKKSDDDESLEPGSLNLSQFPDSSGMVAINSASLRLAPSGTVPKISELEAKYDQYFFNGSIAAITAARSATASQEVDLERGEAICGNMGNVASSFSNLQQGSLCYMKNVPSLSSNTISLEKASDNVTAENVSSTLFAQEADDKLVKVQVDMGEDGQQDIFIKVIGSNTNSNEYKFEMYGCMEGQVESTEMSSINYETRAYTAENKHYFSEGADTSTQTTSISAYIKKEGDGFAWDLSKERVLTERFSHDGSYGSNYGDAEYKISGDNYITSYIHSKSSWTGPGGEDSTGSQKLWSKAAFTGDSALELRVSEMAMAISDSYTFSGENHSRNVKGAVEFKDTKYDETTSSDLYNESQAVDFSQDVYTKTLSEVSVSFSDYDCNATADVVVSFDMTTDEAGEVQQICEGGGDSWEKLDALYDACYGEAVQTARSYTWQ
jgi:hypothetical protein